MRIYATLLVAVIYLCIIPTSNSQSLAAPSDSYRIGSESIEYYPHYGLKEETDVELSGFIRDLLDSFDAANPAQFSYRLLPVKRLYQAFLQSDGIDFKYPDNQDWQPDLRKGKAIFYSDPVIQVIDGVMTRSERTELNSDTLKTLGTIRGFTPQPYIAAIRSGKIRLQEYSKTSDMLLSLLNNRVDGVYLNVDVAYHQLQRIDPINKNVVFNDALPFQVVNYHLSTLKHPEIIYQFNQWMKENPEILRRLQLKYALYGYDKLIK